MFGTSGSPSCWRSARSSPSSPSCAVPDPGDQDPLSQVGTVPGAVDWGMAERIAIRFSGTEPFSQSYHYDSLAPDFEELTAQAQVLVEHHTGWRSSAGDARARVADRTDWVRANIRSFQRMLVPLTDRLEEKMSDGPFAPIAGRIAGAEMGAVLGWMSTRV